MGEFCSEPQLHCTVLYRIYSILLLSVAGKQINDCCAISQSMVAIGSHYIEVHKICPFDSTMLSVTILFCNISYGLASV